MNFVKPNFITLYRYLKCGNFTLFVEEARKSTIFLIFQFFPSYRFRNFIDFFFLNLLKRMNTGIFFVSGLGPLSEGGDSKPRGKAQYHSCWGSCSAFTLIGFGLIFGLKPLIFRVVDPVGSGIICWIWIRSYEVRIWVMHQT